MILCSGAFDGIHAGHVRYIAAAYELRNHAEALMVSVAPDEYIRQAKGREPFWPYDDRREAVLGLKNVLGVTDDCEVTPATAIRLFKPRLFVKGDDWRGKMLPPDVQIACAEVGCKIVYVATLGRHVSEARG